ncbi:globin [Ammoniphilus sp. CFH 90114]|uniref:globin domain-containing protein n=1 Tax=Ammoniphilus sp. CFH 90114 TaxID=2493665 RepID=UPI001F0C46B5|nr:globin [Ammoniphilus sp. CFH 90114]
MSYSSAQTLYDQLGGSARVNQLVQAFYPRVLKDPDLSPLFVDGIDEIMRKQKLFLTQFLGGPILYSEEFGPPAMRARHLPFVVTPRRAKAWLKCMEEAMDEVGIQGSVHDEIIIRLSQVAFQMINSPDRD